MKPLLLAILIACSVTALGQEKPATQQHSKTAEQTPAPQLKAEDLLNIRNLQFDQAKRLLEMQSLKSRYEQLQNESQSFQPALRTMIEAAAKAANVDLTKWEFDSDSLKFVARPMPPKAEDQKPKPGN